MTEPAVSTAISGGTQSGIIAAAAVTAGQIIINNYPPPSQGRRPLLMHGLVTVLTSPSPNVPEPTECAQRRDLVGTARTCIIEIGGKPRS